VTASADKTARIWNAQTGSPEAKPMTHGYEVVYAQFSPDARLLVTIAKHWTSPNYMSQVIRLWDVSTGNPTGDPIPLDDDGGDQSDGPAFAKFSEDGRWLLIIAGSQKRWLDLQVDSSNLAWLADFAAVAGGLELNKAGGFDIIEPLASKLEAVAMELRNYVNFPKSSAPNGR
jgi:WD40 repeat protein